MRSAWRFARPLLAGAAAGGFILLMGWAGARVEASLLLVALVAGGCVPALAALVARRGWSVQEAAVLGGAAWGVATLWFLGLLPDWVLGGTLPRRAAGLVLAALLLAVPAAMGALLGGVAARVARSKGHTR